MKETDKVLLSAGETIEYARQYMHQQGDLIRLEAAEKVSRTSSALITAVAIAMIVFLAVVMLSIAIGIWLGNMWSSFALAFLVLGGIYSMIGLIVYIFREKMITTPVLNFTLNAFFTDEEINPEENT